MKPKILLRSKGKSLEPILRIGKNGLTDSVIEEVKILLKNRKLIKIKLLKSSSKNKKEMINKIIENTDSELIESVGNVVVLYRK
jgi:RNA-binding protein